MLAVKSVRQFYRMPVELADTLETYREMVNHCIQAGLERNITSRFSLSDAVYHELHNGLHTWYILSAVEKASAILRNYRKAKRKNPKTKRPCVSKAFLNIENKGYRIADGKLRLSLKPREHICISLNKHTLQILSQPSLRLGSVTLTASTVNISFSKEIAEIEPSGYVGLDRNLNNITVASSEGDIFRYDLSEATRIKATYREVKSHLRRNDVRIRKRVFAKYGLKERCRVGQILHRVSKDIVDEAKAENLGIVMEKLTGIRKLYRRGNGQGRDYRFRLNSWSFYELQRQVEYKSKWEGIKIIYVPPSGTSSKCSICGSKLVPEENRQMRCPTHGLVDRDLNAARNIVARGLRFGPIAPPVEAMVQEPIGNPESRWLGVQSRGRSVPT